nr:glycosyltransferase family A protein [Roseococcus suduntuyensis]
MLEADSGDVGLNRNAAVAATRARYIAMLDADDIWGPSWLAAAFAVAAAGPPGAVWHPEANLYFGHHGHEHWFMHPDMEAPGFDRTAMELFNPWTALCFARREVFVETPYPASDVAGGFGFEDWHWNLATAARGAIHKIVPGTLHLIRQKPTSLMRRTSAEGALRGPPPE